MSGDDVDLMGMEWPTKAKIEWDERVPRLKWKIDEAGELTDRYELVREGRLLVTRVFKPQFGRDVVMRFVYDRDPER